MLHENISWDELEEEQWNNYFYHKGLIREQTDELEPHILHFYGLRFAGGMSQQKITPCQNLLQITFGCRNSKGFIKNDNRAERSKNHSRERKKNILSFFNFIINWSEQRSSRVV